MVNEFCGNEDLIRQAAILEGAKLDLTLKNFMKEGKDYKGLKKDLRDIIRANDLDDRDLKSGKRGFMHICKRILQVSEDLGTVINPISQIGSFAASTALLGAVNPVALLTSIITIVITFISNRLFRLLWDTIEFKTIKGDAESIVYDLRRMAKKATDPKLKKKYESEADRLEESIKKYSNKRKDNNIED